MGIRLQATLALVFTLVTMTSANATEFCENAANDQEFFRTRAQDPNHRIAFENPQDGALGLKTGLCWWHSRLQRSLIYLANVRPLKNGEKPMSNFEINQAINKLIAESAVVELRGYSSVFEFTRNNQDIIHSKMKWWQAIEALNGVQGLKGTPVVSAAKMQQLMTTLFNAVENKRFVAYQMLQYPGITAHAWLVSHITPIYENLVFAGYELSTIDSNYPVLTKKFIYRPGQTHFKGDFGDFTPYLQWQSSMKRYTTALFKHCKPKAAQAQLVNNLKSAGLYAENLEITADIERKYTLSQRQFEDFNWRELASSSSSVDEKSNKPEHPIE
jgi:hypothetical protein